MSHTHRVVVRDETDHAKALLLAHDLPDAQRYALALHAARPDWHADITPIEAPAVPDGLRAEAAA